MHTLRYIESTLAEGIESWFEGCLQTAQWRRNSRPKRCKRQRPIKHCLCTVQHATNSGEEVQRGQLHALINEEIGNRQKVTKCRWKREATAFFDKAFFKNMMSLEVTCVQELSFQGLNAKANRKDCTVGCAGVLEDLCPLFDGFEK